MITQNQNKINLPAEALAELAKGNKIEAIKIAREKCGVGLKEAKEMVDHYEESGSIGHDNKPGQFSGSLNTSGRIDLPAEALAELTRGNKIGAIKIIREKNGTGLKETKDFVEQYIDANPLLKAKMDTVQARSLRLFLKWLVTIIILIGLCAYIFASK